MLRLIAILFGIGFIFVGVAGFLPSFMVDGLLLGYFEVGTIHNIVYIVSGVLAIMAATSWHYSKRYFQIFGVLYALVTIAGFAWNGDLSIIMMHVNMADNFLHAVIAIIFLCLGYASKKDGQV